MVKSKKKLTLNKESLRRLSADEMGAAAGADSVLNSPNLSVILRPPIVLPPHFSPGTSAVDACPSAMACPIHGGDPLSPIISGGLGGIVIGS
jgi:hypothetical protein